MKKLCEKTVIGFLIVLLLTLFLFCVVAFAYYAIITIHELINGNYHWWYCFWLLPIPIIGAYIITEEKPIIID